MPRANARISFIALTASLLVFGPPVTSSWARRGAVPRTLLQPAAGARGTAVTLSGERFKPRSRVVITVGGRRHRQPARTSRAGRFQIQLQVPSAGGRLVRIEARGGGRRVVARFELHSGPTAGPATELAAANGARVRFLSVAQLGGSRLILSGRNLGRRGRLTLELPGAPEQRFAATRRGTIRASADIPAPSTHSGTLRVHAPGVTTDLSLLQLLPDPTIAAGGDIACGAKSTGGKCLQGATSDLLLRLAPQAVLALGDTQYELGEFADFTRFYDPSWGRLKTITHPVVGNHEYGDSDPATCGYACGYFDYFDGAGQSNGPAGRRSEGFYAFDIGDWRLYALNSNCGNTGAPSCAVGSAQESWLRADLATHPGRCSLVFMHHPLFTSDTRDFDNQQFQDQLRPLWQAFYDAGGDVVLVGHSHFYERYAPQTPTEQVDLARGIRQFIVGTGGRNTYGFGTIEPTSEVHIGRTFGVIKLTLHPGSYDWSFVTIPGDAVADSGSQQCHT